MFVKSFDGAKLYYKYFKKPKSRFTLVFIHGLTLNHSFWGPYIKFFKKKYPVLVWDLRGHGNSELGGAKFNHTTLAKDLSIILKKERIEKPILIGYSLGGGVAVEYYNQFPKNVKKVILINPYIKKSQLRFWFKLSLNLIKYLPFFFYRKKKLETPNFFSALMNIELKTVKKFLRDLGSVKFNKKMPYLMIVSKNDELLKPYPAKRVLIEGKHVTKSKSVIKIISKFLKQC